MTIWQSLAVLCAIVGFMCLAVVMVSVPWELALVALVGTLLIGLAATEVG